MSNATKNQPVSQGGCAATCFQRHAWSRSAYCIPSNEFLVPKVPYPLRLRGFQRLDSRSLANPATLRVNFPHGLIPIGNSQGIRLPKTMIVQAGLTSELELEVGDGQITLRTVGKPRQNWEEEAKACHAANEDTLDDWDSTMTDFEGEWE